jgi:glycogen debranching enzyme
MPHLEDAGIGTISEIFDADWPHAPRGCIAQAWSVAEIMRAYVEDLLEVNPGKSD